MPKTPSQPEESSNRFNPYITTKISKSLLTPCRRVGLSRKKTPNSSSITPKETINGALNSSSLESPPVTSRSVVNETSNPKKKPIEIEKPKRKKVSKCLIVESDSDDELTLSALKTSKPDGQVQVTKENKTKKSKDVILEVQNNVTHEAKKDSDKAEYSTIEKSKEINVPQEVLNNDSKTPIEAHETNKDKAGDSIIEKPKEINVPLQVLKNDSKTPLKTYEAKKTKTIKRSLSLKKSTPIRTDYDECDEMILKDCSIHLTPVEEKLEQPPLNVSEINILEKQVQEKRQLVGDLRQADIYRNKHNVHELQQITAQWKRGCISGLNELLPHFQEHSNTDMETLLATLGVPSHLITLSHSGDLI